MKIIAVYTQLKQLRNKAWKKKKKNSGLNGNRTHDLCEIPVQRSNQLSYQANWELVKNNF